MKTVKHLSDLVIENRSIIDQLIGTPIPSQTELIQEKCQELFTIITQKDSDYLGSMSLLEQDIVMPIISLVRKVYDVPFDVEAYKEHLSHENSQVLPPVDKQPEEEKKVNKLLKNHSDLVSVTAAGVVGSVSSALIKGTPFKLGGIFWGTLAAALVGKLVHSLLSEKKSPQKQTSNLSFSTSEYLLTKSDVDRIIENLTSFGAAVDEVLAKYRNHVEILQAEFSRKTSQFALDQEYLSVLECYQSILGNLSEIESEPSAKDSIKQLNVSLQQQGYRAVHYSADDYALFDAKEGDVAEPLEFKPAIVKSLNGNETLILRGGVLIPNKKN